MMLILSDETTREAVSNLLLVSRFLNASNVEYKPHNTKNAVKNMSTPIIITVMSMVFPGPEKLKAQGSKQK